MTRRRSPTTPEPTTTTYQILFGTAEVKLTMPVTEERSHPTYEGDETLIERLKTELNLPEEGVTPEQLAQALPHLSPGYAINYV